MANSTARTGIAPFAHLLALVTGKSGTGKRAEEGDDIKPDDDGDEGTIDPDEVLDDPDTDVEDVTDPDEPEDKPEGKKKAKGKKAKAEGDDPDDADDDGGYDDKDKAAAYRAGLAAGGVRENARCKAIFSSPAAGLRPDVAAQLAFGTRQTAAEAIGVLTAAAAPGTPIGARGRLADRMNGRRDPQPPAGGGAGGEPSFGDRVTAAVNKARPS